MLPQALRPSRRAFVVSTIAVVLAAGLASGLTASIAVSHYEAEHSSAVRALDERRSLVADTNRLERLAEQRLGTIQRLETRLANNRDDLTYSVARWHALQRKVTALQTIAASLRTDLEAAKADAKSSYDTGYEAGLADGSANSLPSPETSADGCDPNYEGACVPTGYGDVDCGDLIETDFDVVGYDVYGLDGDGDGIACESW